MFAGSALAATGDPLSPDAGRSAGELPFVDAADVLPVAMPPSSWKARAFAYVDGFDERFDARVAAADLGWRLRLRGLGAGLVAALRVQASVSDAESAAESFRADSNALAMLVKNLSESSLGLLGAATLLTGRRAGGSEALAELNAGMAGLLEARAAIQAGRVAPDSEVLPLFRDPDNVPGLDRDEARALLDQFGVGRVFASRQRIAIITPDVLRPQMAGPAIRAWRMAIALWRAPTTCSSRPPCTASCSHDSFPVSRVGDDGLRALEAWCDVLIFQGHVMHDFPWLQRLEEGAARRHLRPDPPRAARAGRARQADWDAPRPSADVTVEVLNEQLARGDYLLCASEKQRDFWLGQLAGAGPPQPLHLRRRCEPRAADRRRAVRRRRRSAAADAARDPGRGARHRPRRQGRAVGRRHLQLVRPADARARHRQAAPASCPKCACSSWASATPTRTCPRCGWRTRRSGWPSELGLTDSTCSSTTAGSTTTTARTSSSTPTSA